MAKTEILISTNWTSLGQFHENNGTNRVVYDVQMGRILTQTVHTVRFRGRVHQLVLDEQSGPELKERRMQPVSGGPGKPWLTFPPLPDIGLPNVRTKE